MKKRLGSIETSRELLSAFRALILLHGINSKKLLNLHVVQRTDRPQKPHYRRCLCNEWTTFTWKKHVPELSELLSTLF
ncbi:hypothetical protein NPIL_467521 [Nephila pilipes]|uniref:Uncharacterized protein n=1 Tax=Nephila pilipes TaxID=299642 RepID=A0A8X6QHG6_NEPPI|nr:hypothetical protein NPIL_467521 [Nephila pilipes]